MHQSKGKSSVKIKTLKSKTVSAHNPKCLFCFPPPLNRLIVGYKDIIRIIDLETFQVLKTYGRLGSEICQIVGVGSNNFAVNCEDCCLRLFSAETDTLHFTLKLSCYHVLSLSKSEIGYIENTFQSVKIFSFSKNTTTKNSKIKGLNENSILKNSLTNKNTLFASVCDELGSKVRLVDFENIKDVSFIGSLRDKSMIRTFASTFVRTPFSDFREILIIVLEEATSTLNCKFLIYDVSSSDGNCSKMISLKSVVGFGTRYESLSTADFTNDNYFICGSRSGKAYVFELQLSVKSEESEELERVESEIFSLSEVETRKNENDSEIEYQIINKCVKVVHGGKVNQLQIVKVNSGSEKVKLISCGKDCTIRISEVEGMVNAKYLLSVKEKDLEERINFLKYLVMFDDRKEIQNDKCLLRIKGTSKEIIFSSKFFCCL